MLRHAFVPTDFRFGIIKPLLKDKHGDPTKLEMYRGITLAPVFSKLFESVLLAVYGDFLQSDKLQFGFKKDSGCCHALFTFAEATKYFTSRGSKVHCAFLDASKAFDKILHFGLFAKLIDRGIPLAFLRVLVSWYMGTCNVALFGILCLVTLFLLNVESVRGVFCHPSCLRYTWMFS